jgi:hypothetical protein
VWGCMAIYFIPQEYKKKWERKGEWGIFLGVSPEHKGWVFCNLKREMSREVISHTAIFFEELTFKLFLQRLKDNDERKQLEHWMHHALDEAGTPPGSPSKD